MNKISSEAVGKVANAIYSVTPDLDTCRGTAPWYSTTLVELNFDEACSDSKNIAEQRAKAAIATLLSSGEVVLRADVEAATRAAEAEIMRRDQALYDHRIMIESLRADLEKRHAIMMHMADRLEHYGEKFDEAEYDAIIARLTANVAR